VGIVMVEVVVDGRFEFGHRGENTAPDAVMSDQAEEALDSSCARSSADSQTQISVFIRQLLHNPTQKEIFC